MNATVNGWHFDPTGQTWTAKIDGHWLTVTGTFDNPPHCSPESLR